MHVCVDAVCTQHALLEERALRHEGRGEMNNGCKEDIGGSVSRPSVLMLFRSAAFDRRFLARCSRSLQSQSGDDEVVFGGFDGKNMTGRIGLLPGANDSRLLSGEAASVGRVPGGVSVTRLAWQDLA